MDDHEYLREQIYNSLKLWETQELIDMLEKHDSEEWTELAFQVAREILRKRGEEAPAETDTTRSTWTFDSPPLEAAPAAEQTDTESQQSLVCPNCKSGNIYMRSVELQNQMRSVVLKKPEAGLSRFLGLDTDYDEIVAFACEDCGHVFFMLKDFVPDSG